MLIVFYSLMRQDTHTKTIGIGMFGTTGWRRFKANDEIKKWANAARKFANGAAQNPDLKEKWLQCEGTWYVGVDVLPSDEDGRFDGFELAGPVSDLIQSVATKPLHPAQVSIIYPGYPKPRQGETKAGFNYRLKRDAAHVDGLLPVGAQRRRMLREPHAYVIGLPLNTCDTKASPMVVWEGSHLIMHKAFQTALSPYPAAQWPDIDLSDVYHAARREVFEKCRRVAVHAEPGQAYAIHRLALHGIAPWQAGANAPSEGRMIAYFRPELSDIGEWPNL